MITPKPLLASIVGAAWVVRVRSSASISVISSVRSWWRRARRRSAWLVAAVTESIAGLGRVAARVSIKWSPSRVVNRALRACGAVTSRDVICRCAATRAFIAERRTAISTRTCSTGPLLVFATGRLSGSARACCAVA